MFYEVQVGRRSESAIIVLQFVETNLIGGRETNISVCVCVQVPMIVASVNKFVLPLRKINYRKTACFITQSSWTVSRPAIRELMTTSLNNNE